MKKFFFLFACLTLLSLAVKAQYSKYIIQFKDKNGSTYTLANPSGYLSAKAIERRNRQKIKIDSTDLPVSPAYMDSIRSLKNVTILNKSNWLNQVCIRTTDANAITRISSFPFVKASQPVATRQNMVTPFIEDKIEELSPSSFRMNNTRAVSANNLNYGNTFSQIHIHAGDFLHNYNFTGEGITIAVLDGGFLGYKTNAAFDSVRLQNRILGEWDFVANEQSVNEDNAHGMYCFSIMAANRPGLMIGSAPRAKFYLFRTEDVGSEYPVEEQNWAAAAELADSLGVDMISSSLGYSNFDDPSFDHSFPERNGNTTIVTRAADLAAKKGMIIMNSAGNSGGNLSDLKYIACPADGDSVVAVGAVDVNGRIAGFSSWGPNGAGKIKPNIVSVGQGTTIAGLDGNPVSGNGTSFSNPNIAGLIACLWQAFPEYTNMEIIDAVQKSAHKYNNPDDRFGYGIPDFKKAFSSLLIKSFYGTISNDNCITTLEWAGKDDKAMRYEIERKAGFDTGYIKIASINGKSATFSLNNYSYKDTSKYLAATVVSYRLKQVVQEDTVLVLISSTLNITDICNADNGIIISPNPFKNNINVIINTPGAIPKMSIALHNMKGERLYYYEGSKANSLFSLTIPGIRLPEGGYIVTIRDNRGIIFSKKIVK